MVILKGFFEKVDFEEEEKYQETTKCTKKKPRMQRVKEDAHG